MLHVEWLEMISFHNLRSFFVNLDTFLHLYNLKKKTVWEKRNGQNLEILKLFQSSLSVDIVTLSLILITINETKADFPIRKMRRKQKKITFSRRSSIRSTIKHLYFVLIASPLCLRGYKIKNSIKESEKKSWAQKFYFYTKLNGRNWLISDLSIKH